MVFSELHLNLDKPKQKIRHPIGHFGDFEHIVLANNIPRQNNDSDLEEFLNICSLKNLILREPHYMQRRQNRKVTHALLA